MFSAINMNLSIFSDVPIPKYSQGTEIILPVSDENMNELGPRLSNYRSRQWQTTVIQWEERSLLIEINPAVDCLIGEWSLTIETRSRVSDFRKYSSYNVPKRIFILFNSWNKGKRFFFFLRNKFSVTVCIVS